MQLAVFQWCYIHSGKTCNKNIFCTDVAFLIAHCFVMKEILCKMPSSLDVSRSSEAMIGPHVIQSWSDLVA